jgi:hypothetical protein
MCPASPFFLSHCSVKTNKSTALNYQNFSNPLDSGSSNRIENMCVATTIKFHRFQASIS